MPKGLLKSIGFDFDAENFHWSLAGAGLNGRYSVLLLLCSKTHPYLQEALLDK